MATIRFASGALAALHATTAAYPGLSARVQVHGCAGSARIVLVDDVSTSVAGIRRRRSSSASTEPRRRPWPRGPDRSRRRTAAPGGGRRGRPPAWTTPASSMPPAARRSSRSRDSAWIGDIARFDAHRPPLAGERLEAVELLCRRMRRPMAAPPRRRIGGERGRRRQDEVGPPRRGARRWRRLLRRGHRSRARYFLARRPRWLSRRGGTGTGWSPGRSGRRRATPRQVRSRR